MTQEEFRYLLKRYKTGVATPAERALVEQWYDTVGRDEPTHMSPEEEQSLEKHFLGHVDHYIATAKTGKQRLLGFWQAASIAASLLLVSVFLVYFFSPGSIPENHTTIPMRAAEDAEELVTVAATEVRHVQLKDGSTVTLQPGSTLSYDIHNYNDTRREVFLQGEGFFEVTHDTQKPFYVFTGEVATRVLGTSFTVKTAGPKREIIVAVNTGRVAVATKRSELFGLKASYQQEAVLTPNQQAVFKIDGKVLTTGLVDAPRVISPETTPEQMAFDDVALAEILEDIEQAYQIDIVFDPERISACFVTAKFDKENLFERLDIICKAAGAHYVVSGAQIIISK
jgi:ferric-dicitrate binding protein FerR (iron transport regulator)